MKTPSPYKLFLIVLTIWQIYYIIPPVYSIIREMSLLPIVEPLIGTMMNLTFYVIILLVLRKYAKSKGRPELGTLKPRRRSGWRFRIFLGASLGIIANLVARVFSSLLSGVSPAFYQPIAHPVAIAYYVIHVATSVILYLIVAVAEEGIFRGYIMEELLKQHNYLKALLASSILFAFYHVNFINPIITLSPLSLLPQLSNATGPFLFGLAAGYLYKATDRNLTAPTAYHFTFDLFRAIL